MSHRDNCPSDYEARSRARDDARFDHDYGWGRSYHNRFDCDEAQDAYRREYSYQMDRLEEERQMERAAERRREECRQEEEEMERQYYEQAQQQAEAEYLAQLEAESAQPDPNSQPQQ